MSTPPLRPIQPVLPTLSPDAAAIIKRTALNALSPAQVNQVQLAMLPQVLPANHVLHLVDAQIVVKQPSALVFIDHMPQGNWGHPCTYRFHDPTTGALLQEEQAMFPPDMNNPSTLQIFHAPVAPLTATTLPSLTHVGNLVNPIFLQPTHVSEQRYAILFASQISDLRHVEDLEFLWRALVNVYGFSADNIYVLSYNGTLAAVDKAAPVGNWAGDNTAYQMKIHSSATTANLQSVFDTLKTKLAPKDLLLIHTNNHGSSSGLCVDSSTIITPTQFGTMISGLPKYRSLVVTMEQCFSGAFQNSTLTKSTAVNTVFASAVDAKTSSDGASHFDPWALAWIEALVSTTAAGAALSTKPCPNFEGLVSMKAACDWAKTNDTGKDDDPQYADQPAGCGSNIFLGVAPGPAMRSGDLNADGCAEHVVTSPWGIGVLEEKNGTMLGLVCQPNGTRFGGWLLETADNQLGPIADFDGDGKAEVIIFSPWGLGMLKLNGATFDAPFMAPNGTSLGGWVLDTGSDSFTAAADFDGDGHAELLVMGASGMGILKLTGSTMTCIMHATNETFLGGWRLETNINFFSAAADFDGDGKAELLLTSPWGIGLLKLSGSTMTTIAIQPNGTRFGGWLLDTSNNHIGRAADYDGDHHAEVLVTSPWGMGILKLAGNTFSCPMLQPNGTRFGGWLLDTFHNKIGPAADYDGDGKAELFLSSPWGIGIIKLAGNTMSCPMLQPNGTRFGGWLLNTVDNKFGPGARYNGVPASQVFVSSPWGIGILGLNGNTMSCPMLQPNGTRFGGWLLNTADNIL